MDDLLKLLKGNARLTNQELAVMLGITAEEVAARIEEYENKGIIKGYSAICDDTIIDPQKVTALIELKITPQHQSGFDMIANQISSYEQVESVMLMSGAYDILLTVRGHSILEVSQFVSQRLAGIRDVTSTTTHFMLKNYKENGIIICSEEKDERGLVSP